ncbi:MAG: hypothetical protein QOK43_1857 [Acidimicrobiaceae bacterium]|nr:hypothetical protein [Acidimicrobiaceae bacterium]
MSTCSAFEALAGASALRPRPGRLVRRVDPCAPRRGRRRWRTATAAAVVAMAFVAGSCRGGPESRSESKPTTTVATSSTTISTSVLTSDQTAVLDAYVRCWQAYIDFGTEKTRSFTRADFDARLGGCLTGAQYNTQLSAFSKYRPLGVFFRGPPVQHDPEPDVVVTGTKAVVRDCMNDQGVVYDDDDGRVLDDASGSRSLNIVSLVLVDGAWKIEDAKDGGPCTV